MKHFNQGELLLPLSTKKYCDSFHEKKTKHFLDLSKTKDDAPTSTRLFNPTIRSIFCSQITGS